MNEICLSCRKHTKCGRAEHETIGCGYYVPMTNEEYLRSCTTEQLAEWLAKQKCDGCNDEPYDDKHGTCKYCMTKKTEQIREWLKQPKE